MDDNFFRRLLDQKNKKGKGAYDLELRHTVKKYKDGVWDCNDRAEVAKRMLEADGCTAEDTITHRKGEKLNHRYIKANCNGKQFDVGK